MAYRSGKQWAVSVVFLTVIVLSIGIIELTNRNQTTFIRESLLIRAKEELSIIRSELEAAVVSDIYVANSLAAFVTVNPSGDFDNWDKMASNIIREGKHIKVIGLAPGDIIRHIYPLKGNERALNLDYRTVPAQWRSVEKAREIQEIFIAGPVSLVQGSRALIARVPIFTDPPQNTQYWGVCSVVIDLESLFQSVGIKAFEHKYHLAMKGVDSEGDSGAIFFGDQTIFDNAFSREVVRFPYGSWIIAASEKNDLLKQLPWYRTNIVRLFGYPIMALLIFSFVAIYRLYAVANKRSLHDELTKLPNRRYFMYTLEHHFDQVQHNGQKETFALLNIDLDKFKAINDLYGHAAGDKVLIACAERIKSVLRTSDVVARVGGDEFLVLLPRISNKNDVDVINIELQKAICLTPVIYEQHLISVHVSVGYAFYNKDVLDIEGMLKKADENMYEEKRRHRT
ncbi:diguanylate cyclase [Vibrio paucivorans]|uniref:Sensor domain-containing diguanylate cyclase n=1 Tax=Vibrio paucivorans TaxID=2829489 RepID=A0A9X3CGI2_9VIBR|nr:diguanylate cyclase [Vibrio paucivorans]MCW8335403.1 sensor domain-containing diguanylate cyclase [Vibrio paucivorans]